MSQRDLEVVRLPAEGLQHAKMTERLVVSVNTMRFQVKVIYGKLGVDWQAQVVERAIVEGVVTQNQGVKTPS